MIQNKKLFIIGIIALFLGVAGMMPWFIPWVMAMGAAKMEGWYFIYTGISASIAYTLIFLSLRKTVIVKRVYGVALFIGIAVTVIGILEKCLGLGMVG